MNLRVLKIQDVAQGIRAFELGREDGADLLPFTAGAHIDLHLAAGLIRQYSLCNAPSQRDRYVIAVKKEAESRGGSHALHDAVKVGDCLHVTGPRNHFPLADSASEHLLLAGGIGVTPLLSMARSLMAAGQKFRLHYFARSPMHAAFVDELHGNEWAGAVEFHLGLQGDALCEKLRFLLGEHRKDAHVYVCGPRPFMDLVIETASHAYPAGAIHHEYFSADTAAQAKPGADFTVHCKRSGTSFDVGQDESLLNVLTRHGVHVEVMCEQGVCGTCLTGVLEGRPDHRDAFLTGDERAANDKMLVCCSRSLDRRLVLDL